ncbi:uncharacterized protein LOC135080208 [Ostrinia nubilalis]|uniref:uncharacterized protein LOC135080208 n=1 Tax=Ostrinia nubilalis TaxID=29057 RepID=UPI00308232D9
MRLYLYHVAGYGPPTLLLAKGAPSSTVHSVPCRLQPPGRAQAARGPAPPEAATPWMRLYLYHVAGYGPPTLLLTKGAPSSTVHSVPCRLQPPGRAQAARGPAPPKAATPWMRLYLYHVAGYGPPTLLLAKGAPSSTVHSVPCRLQPPGRAQAARGPAPPEAATPWMRLYLYHVAGYGPPTLLLAKGAPSSTVHSVPCRLQPPGRAQAARGPAPPEAATPWMRLYLYHVAGYGPPTLLLTKGAPSSTVHSVPCRLQPPGRAQAARGPAPPEAATPWMRLYLYHVAGYGPPTLLLTKGAPSSTVHSVPCRLQPPGRAQAARGPAPPEAATPWMRLYLYHVAGYGPPTLLLTKGAPSSTVHSVPCRLQPPGRAQAARGPAPPEAATPWMRLYLYHVAGYGPPTLLLTKGAPSSTVHSVPCRLQPPGRAQAARGPAPPEAATPWMRLYLYHVAGYGPPTLLLTKGTVLRCIPRALLGYSRLAVSWWGAEAALEGGTALPAAAALAAANSALRRGPVLLQAAGVRQAASFTHIMFPPENDERYGNDPYQSLWYRHAGLRRLLQRLRLTRSAGYVTLCDIGVPDLGCARPPPAVQLLPSRKKKDVCGIAKPVSEISLSSNDSTEKTAADYSKRLQSPIESHFAVTPTIDSKTSSPANGFTSVECGQLLCEELDNLAIDDDSKQSHQSKESIAGSDDIVQINSSSTSIEDLKEKSDLKKNSLENSTSKESISFSDDLVAINSTSISVENLKFDSKKGSDTASEKSMSQLNDLLSPAEESISMFTQLSNKLTEITAEGDSGVDTTHNLSDDETCKPEKWTILDLQFGIPLFDEVLCEKICQCIVERIAKPDLFEKVKEDNDFIRSDVLKFVSQCQYYPGEDMGIVKRGTLVPLPRRNLVFENGRISEWAGK